MIKKWNTKKILLYTLKCASFLILFCIHALSPSISSAAEVIIADHTVVDSTIQYRPPG